jgi:hypothetical protein
LLSLDPSLAIPTRVLRFEVSKLRHCTLVRPVRCCCTSVFGSLVLALWINQGTQWFFGEPPETPRTWCSLRQSPLMTLLPRSPGSTLVLRLNQETVYDFILSFLPPCGPHSTLLATGSLEPSLLVFSTPGGLTGNDISRFFFTCTNTSLSPNLHLQYLAKNQSTQRCHHSSQQEATIHRSSNHTWSSVAWPRAHNTWWATTTVRR